VHFDGNFTLSTGSSFDYRSPTTAKPYDPTPSNTAFHYLLRDVFFSRVYRLEKDFPAKSAINHERRSRGFNPISAA
jgi:hypothetical protein